VTATHLRHIDLKPYTYRYAGIKKIVASEEMSDKAPKKCALNLASVNNFRYIRYGRAMG
jgi:hypothetical protein